MKIFSLIIFIVIFNLLFSGCSAGLNVKESGDTNLRITDIQSWLNLMPGGPGSFHISGKYQFPKKFDEKEIFLNKIIILEKDKEIYSLAAELQFIGNSGNLLKEFTFNNVYQTKIDPILLQNDTIDVQLVFYFKGQEFRKEFKSIPLNRAY